MPRGAGGSGQTAEGGPGGAATREWGPSAQPLGYLHLQSPGSCPGAMQQLLPTACPLGDFRPPACPTGTPTSATAGGGLESHHCDPSLWDLGVQGKGAVIPPWGEEHLLSPVSVLGWPLHRAKSGSCPSAGKQ